MCLQFTPQLGKVIKVWIMNNIRLGHLVAQIMAKHEQHPFIESWTCSHFVLPHDICNAMDMYVSLEYKHHWNLATSIRLWAKCSFFNKKNSLTINEAKNFYRNSNCFPKKVDGRSWQSKGSLMHPQVP